MRSFRGYTRQFGGSFAAGAVHANTVNINHITQITQTVCPGCSNCFRTHQFSRKGRQNDRRPRHRSELLRYLYEGRSEVELCEESVRTLGTSAHVLGSCASRIGRDVVGMTTCFAKGTIGLIAALFGKNIA